MSACFVILAHVAWALAREWALFIRAAKSVTWALARDTTVIIILYDYVYSELAKDLENLMIAVSMGNSPYP